MKRTADGAYRSVGALSNGGGAGAETALADVTAEQLRNQEVIGNMLVLRTDPGQAQGFAITIDRAQLPEIAGTIAGDDTILVICRSPEGAQQVAQRFVGFQIEA